MTTALGLGLGMPFRRGGFTPASLFVNGEEGVWYDPSDYGVGGTLFTDAAGTTPVTAVEQPVRLMLDKSKGLVLGPELLGSGVVGLVGTATAATYSTTTGVGSATRVDVNNQSFVQWTLPNSVEGYRVNISCASGTLWIRSGGSGGNIAFTVNAGDTVNGYVTPTSNLITVTAVSGTATFTVNSFKLLPGNHATAPNDSARPVLRARYNLLERTEEFENAYWAKNALNAFGSGSVANTNATTDPRGNNTADYLQENSANNVHFVGKNIAITAVDHKFSIYAKAAERSFIALVGESNGSKAARFNLSNGTIVSTGALATSAIENAGNGWYQCSITFTGSGVAADTYVATLETGGGSLVYTGNGTSGVYYWGADLRVTNDALNMPAYQRVAAATDYDTNGFLPYLAFDGNDDAMSTSAIDFSGTDKMTVVSGDRKLADGAFGVVVELTADADANAGSFLYGEDSSAGNGVQVGAIGARVYGVITGSAAPVTWINSIVFDRALSNQSEIAWRRNATSVSTAGLSVQGGGTSGNFANSALNIGARNNGASLRANIRLYGLIVRGAASSAAEIAATEAWVNARTGAY